MIRAVVDAGPFIALSKIGHLNLLRQMFDEVIAPVEVLEELTASVTLRPGHEVGSLDWIHRSATDLAARQALQGTHDVDKGEAAAILAAQALADSVLVIDDLRGLRVARSRGVRTLRTGAFLIAAERRGLIHARDVEAALTRLEDERYLKAQDARDIMRLLRTKS